MGSVAWSGCRVGRLSGLERSLWRSCPLAGPRMLLGAGARSSARARLRGGRLRPTGGCRSPSSRTRARLGRAYASSPAGPATGSPSPAPAQILTLHKPVAALAVARPVAADGEGNGCDGRAALPGREPACPARRRPPASGQGELPARQRPEQVADRASHLRRGALPEPLPGDRRPLLRRSGPSSSTT